MSNEQEYLDGRAGRALDVRDRYIDELRAEAAQWQAAIAEQPVVAWTDFDAAYKKACESSDPHDYFRAALLAQQVRAALPPKAEPAPQGVQGWSHWEARIKALMWQVGLPHSHSLFQAFSQLVNEMSRSTEPSKPVQAEAPTASNAERATGERG